MFLVRAAMTLADGRVCDGFVRPAGAGRGNDLSETQPHLFLPSGKLVGFWHGMFKHLPHVKALYDEFGDRAATIFPIRFTIAARLATGVSKGRIIGFCRLRGGKVKEYFGRRRE